MAHRGPGWRPGSTARLDGSSARARPGRLPRAYLAAGADAGERGGDLREVSRLYTRWRSRRDDRTRARGELSSAFQSHFWNLFP